MEEYAIVIDKVEKRFAGIHALKSVSLKVKRGDIHAIVGENGAGKSTLMKILAGIYTKDSGRLQINGQEVHFTAPGQSREHHIGIIYQELALVPDLTVAENIFLNDLGAGKHIINRKQLNQNASGVLRRLGFALSPEEKVGNLSVAYQQMAEIAKSLARDVRILILDEPTAVLSGQEIHSLFNQLKRLKDQGVTILYISHRLEEIFIIADSISVMKDGESVADFDSITCTADDIISAMVGRQVANLYPSRNGNIPQQQEILRVENLSTRTLLSDINFHVRRGEIVGFAGLVGSGRTEIARCLFGIDRMTSGTVKKKGQLVTIHCPADAMRHGIGLVPENRKEQGAILAQSIRENISISRLKDVCYCFGIINQRRDKQRAQEYRQKLKIKLASLEHPLSSLSGGNQQKVVIAKWLNTHCDLLILDEPTRGMDVGAKVEIYHLIHQLAGRGYAIILISSEMAEVINLSHRVYVMSDGRISRELIADGITEENIIKHAIAKRALA